MATGRVPLAGAFAVCAVVCLSACGTSGPRREYTKADEQLAARIAFRSSDVPPDWKADPAVGKSSVPRRCYDGILKHLLVTGEAATGFFEGPKEFSESPNYAASYVIVFASRGTAISALIRMRKTASLRCLAPDLERRLLESTSIKHLSIRPLRMPKLGERSNAAELAIDFPKSSFVPRAYVDVVLVQRGRAFSLLLFGDVGNPFDPAQERQLARAVAARMPGS